MNPLSLPYVPSGFYKILSLKVTLQAHKGNRVVNNVSTHRKIHIKMVEIVSHFTLLYNFELSSLTPETY